MKDELVYPHERPLGRITLVLGLLFWLLLIVGSFGIALLVLALGFVLYLFAQSALIAHIKGQGVALSESQFPDLYRQFVVCCDRLQIDRRPEAYVLSGNGAMNAFATQFLGRQYVVLLSDVVDAMDAHADGVSFYIGHELGHLRMKHLSGALLRWPALWLPLLGAAYSRARESTCDRHGLACSSSPENAARALAALSAGAKRWAQLDFAAYSNQLRSSAGFWMSFHELTAGYPWLSKRVARVLDTGAPLPRRNALAYLAAIFVPYAGRLGAGFGLLILVYIIGVLAAVAIPSYQNYVVKAKLTMLAEETRPTRDALAAYYLAKDTAPESLKSAGIAAQLKDGSPLSLDSENMALTITTAHGELVFVPSVDKQGSVTWSCVVGEGQIKPIQLPSSCKDKPASP